MVNNRKLSFLKKRSEFLQLIRCGRKIRGDFVNLNLSMTETQCCRFGITIPKKIGSSVIRNRIRRRTREFLRSRQFFLNRDVNIVFQVRDPVFYKELDSENLQVTLSKVFEKAITPF